MIVVKTILAEDPYGGLCLSAAHDISKGDLVWCENPQFTLRLSLPEYRTLIDADPIQGEFLQHFAYSAEFLQDGQRLAVVDLDTDIGSFLNHSETPNLVSSTLLQPSGRHADTNVALKDIKAGEPLGYDYRGFVADIVAWHGSAKVRTCASFLIEPTQASLTSPKSKWRSQADFDASVQNLKVNLLSLRAASRESFTAA